MNSQKALITGAARGIGRASALALASCGFDIVFSYFRSQEAALALKAEIQSLGVQATALQGDINDQTHRQELAEVLGEAPFMVLVNNAGITADNLLVRMSETEWEQVINTNFLAPLLLAEACIPKMLAQRAGRIINISSVVGVHGNAGQTNYAFAKSALNKYTKLRARELMPLVQVNSIAPGLVKTDMTSKFNLAELEQSKLGRAANPEDIAKAVCWLAGKESGAYVTGQILEIDGGLSLHSSVQALVS